MLESEIREAIERMSALIGAEPAKAKVKNPPATARVTGGLSCEITGPRGERAATDMPPAVGGAGQGPNPAWYLRAAMASCTATVIAMRAAKLGIALRTLEVTVESDSDMRGMLGLDDKVSAGLSGLRTRVKIAGDAAAPALRDLVAWGDAHSPVGCTVRNAPAAPLDIEVV